MNCKVENCMGKVLATELCNMHYIRNNRYGRLTRVNANGHSITHREYMREWRKTPKGKAQHANWKNLKRAGAENTDITSKWLAELWEAATHCIICGIRMDDNGKYPNGRQLDHIIRLADDGRHIMSNVRYICAQCNLMRHGKEVLYD